MLQQIKDLKKKLLTTVINKENLFIGVMAYREWLLLTNGLTAD